MWPRADSAAAARLQPDNPAPDSLATGRQAAVIDVGSNSVRLVIYRLEGRTLWTVFNEKSLAGLGRELPRTGKLSSDGAEAALAALRRFRAVLEGWEPGSVFAVATAAVREARDGPAFLRRVEEETGLSIRLLSGEDEARFAALGVIAGEPDAAGVVGDMGGSSLELIRLNAGGPGDGVSLPLGPFALGAPKPLDIDAARRLVDQRLKPVADRFLTREFHAVGGAWRNLALLHMVIADYPLRVAHQYAISRADALDVARFVARQSQRSLERIEGMSKKRFDTLPYSALVLEALIERLQIERVTISAYGLREGLLFETMSPAERTRDPLLEGCEALTAARGLTPALGAPIEAWLRPAFAALEPLFSGRDAVMLGAVARLADLGARLHPDHRADVVFDQVLRAPLAGLSHPERAFLACAAFARHTAASTAPHPEIVARVLSAERRQRARALGAGVRLASDLMGRNPKLLEQSHLSIDGDRLVLSAEPGWADILLGEQIAKRAATLAQILRLKLQLG